ncbi:FkbM family methyltransferase [Lacinutrix chionoecetis]
MNKGIYKNINRLIFKNRFKIILFHFKRFFKIPNSPEWYGLKEYFLKLIEVDGKQINEDKRHYYTQINSLIFKLRKRPSSDISVFGQVFEEKEYDVVLNKYASVFKNKPQTIIDAGSNIGLTSLYFYSKLKNSEIIAIEPDDENFKILQYNLETNLVNANALKAGLWSKNTYLKLIKDFRDKKEWSVRVEESESEGLLAVTISSLLKDHKWETIDILKIDIEGAEKEVFTAEQTDVSFLSKTKCIAIEIHDEFNCRDEINTILHNYNFDCFKSGELTIGINKMLLNK